MEVDINAVNELIQEEYRGNQTWFSEEIGINVSYFNEILNGKKSPKSNKLCTAMIKFCEKTKRNYKKYIIFFD
ncbi:MAG: hypothetical protein J6K45_06370 [Clostridia bacterium]|nr:hypothetical protein [Clostridia bacterium]